MYYVYILKNKIDKSWYIGYSANLKKRIKEHLSGNGCQTTSKKHNWELIYYEAYLNKYDALGREKFLKSGAGRKYLNKQMKNYLAINTSD
jgi:putative endonuclease